jgi:Protein of unknown function (DUF3082)
MNDKTSPAKTKDSSPKVDRDKATPFNCLMASLISGGLAFAVYSLMAAIIQTYANKPVVADNEIVLRITVAVRTLVIGVAALGTGVFGFVAVGLFLLGLQVTFKSFQAKN